MVKSKRKLIISMLVLLFVMLSAVAIVAIAFALTQQTITTTLNMTYTVEDLDGSVMATYKVGGVETYLTPHATGGTVSGNSLVFSANDTQEAGSLEFPNDINLTSANRDVVIKYTYANTGDKHYVASMSFDSDLTFNNMSVTYSTDGTNYSTNRYAVVVPAGVTGRSYWIKISIEKISESANFKGNFKWNLSGYDKTDEAYPSLTSLEFTGSNGSYKASISSAGGQEGKIVFPSAVNDDPVIKIVESSILTEEQKQSITSVYIPDSVTEIGVSAFNGYTNLQTVTFEQNITANKASAQSVGTGLKKLGMCAFYNCKNLSNFKIPNTVTYIGDAAFQYCENITEITIPHGVTDIIGNAFVGCAQRLTKIEVEAGNSTFHSENNCLINTANKEIILGCKNSVIPTDGLVTKIGHHAFYKCTGLTSISIPSCVTTLMEYSFYWCLNLNNITIPDGVTTLKNNSLMYCTKLTSVTIPSSVTSLQGSIFSGCTELTSLQVDANNTVYRSEANCIIEIATNTLIVGSNGCTEIPNGVTSIGQEAFPNGNITSIIIPDTVTSIQDYAFIACGNLKSVSIPSSVKSIGKYAFQDCKKITNITLSEGLTDIGYCAFKNCLSLTDINIPKSVQGFTVGVFSGCSNLTRVELDDADSVDYVAFEDNETGGASFENYTTAEAFSKFFTETYKKYDKWTCLVIRK